jgi:thiol-disulfide isomerase/thioredoxin
MRRVGALTVAVLGFALLGSREASPAGRPAPACALTALDGAAPVAFAPARGKVLWVDFWASWCPSCAESFPFLIALDRDFRARGLEVVAINLDEEPEEARAFLARYGVRFELAADRTGECPRAFGVDAIPSAVLVDRDGVIRYVHRGFRAADADALRARVDSLLEEGRVTPPPAPAEPTHEAAR